MESSSLELAKELRGLKSDEVMTKRAIESQQQIWKERLDKGIGFEITETLNGNIKNEIPFKLKFKYFIKKLKNKITKVT